MTTKLFNLGYLLKPTTFYVLVIATPAGQPFDTAPWFLLAQVLKVSSYTTALDPKQDASITTDWVLVSLRTSTSVIFYCLH
ncbi:MAG: hypothetical protein IPG00_20630 [Saprospiraceae bacterium]|nr:hypothetical protein [Saprospiraceae bacterium]